ncbi:protein kinase [Streptosporangium sp. NPDC051022]|uniref:serine/threonine-protein kinase n=1 Tax=Streptosporangium sp. NPDC051022 TaxID=3155752 RepID=UPI0034418992
MYGTPSSWRVPGYTELRELGAGAGGRVVMARHDVDGIMVAIKYLSDELRSDVGFVARFRHEARVLNTLDSPHAVRLYDYVETGEGAAIVMELVDGVALRAILRSEGPTGPEAALVVLKGALLGLSTAHTAGVVHRDFKPENVMVEADGTSKLVDFGVAIRSGDDDTPAGTPPYMAPEQWTGAPAGPSSDVYAATVVFFECLTGTRPFRATNVAALARQHQTMPPPVEEVAPALQGLVERGLAKHPADRPPTATAFLTELEAVAADAYGPDWQERGRRRLAGLAALLPALFPLETPKPGGGTSVAETKLGGRRRSSSSLSRLSVKILVGVGCIAVIGGVTAVLVNSAGSTEIKPQSLVTSESPTSPEAVESILPADSDLPTQEPTEKPSKESTPKPAPTETPAATSAATFPPTAPTKAATPTPKPSPTRTRRPTKSPAPPPTPTPSPTEEGNSPLGDSDHSSPAKPPTKPPAPTPTPTRSTSEPRPTSRPTQTSRPTRTPTTEPSSPTATPSSPEPSNTSTDGGGPRLTATPTPPGETAPPTLLAFGLVTGGAIPFTLAVKRGAAGRHRRRRRR